MWFFYICAIIPVIVGLIFFLQKNNRVTWQEWVGSSVIAFVMAALFHVLSIMGMTADTETWSGQIVDTRHYGEWVEEYQERHSETYYTGTGENRRSHTRVWYTTEHDTHREKWTVSRNFGDYEDEVQIEESVYDDIYSKFGSIVNSTEEQDTDHFGGSYDGGDRNIYITRNNTGYIYPVTIIRSFENRIKASPSLFSFAKVPTNIVVYSWPDNSNWMASDRLCGTAALLIDPYKFDCMNTELGPFKRVNVILVGFGNKGSEYGQWQEANWIGGKKNDLVICFGGGTKTNPAEWSYVFGWTEKEIVKQNLQTILLNNPINDDLIPLISSEIVENYTIKDWSKFDYISIDPPTWSYWVYFIVMIIGQGGLYWWFHVNEFTKDGTHSFRPRLYRPYNRNKTIW